MEIISINIGQPQTISWQGRAVETAIFKKTVEGVQKVEFLGVEGDKQADSKHHGGVNKAIYCYDNSYYDWWKANLENVDWNWGMFGENLTTKGLIDKDVCLGSIYKAGTVVFQATAPRIPCFKLNIRFGKEDMLERFYAQKCYGIYCKILTEGHLQAGDKIELLEKSKYAISIADVSESYANKGKNQDLLKAILKVPFLGEDLQKTLGRFQK